MSVFKTRVALIRRLARAASRERLARMLQRLGADGVAALLGQLGALELRRIAAVLLAPEHCEATLATYQEPSLRLLVYAAPGDDAVRALSTLTPARAARLLTGMPPARRAELLASLEDRHRSRVIRALPRSARPRRKDPSQALRLRRLFA